MRPFLPLAVAAVVLAGASGALAAERPVPPPQVLPVDVETRVGHIDLACTGIGADARAAPGWQSYGVRVEFSNARNEYLVGAVVTVRDAAGRPELSVRCDAPWLLMRLPAGLHQVEGQLVDSAARPRSARVSPPARGQMRVVLQFPDA